MNTAKKLKRTLIAAAASLLFAANASAETKEIDISTFPKGSSNAMEANLLSDSDIKLTGTWSPNHTVSVRYDKTKVEKILFSDVTINAPQSHFTYSLTTDPTLDTSIQIADSKINLGYISVDQTTTVTVEDSEIEVNELYVYGSFSMTGGKLTITKNDGTNSFNGGNLSFNGAEISLKQGASAFSFNNLTLTGGTTLTADADISCSSLTISTDSEFSVTKTDAKVTFSAINIQLAEDFTGSVVELGKNGTLSDGSEISILSADGDILKTETLSGGKTSIAVPEPSAFGVLAGIGALALVAARRRRN